MLQLYWWTTQNHFSQRVQMSLRTHIKYSNAIKCHHKSKSQRTYHTASSGSWPLSRWGRSPTGQRDHSSITYTPNLRERHTQCLLRHRAGDNVLDRLHVHFLVVFSSSPVSLLSSIWLILFVYTVLLFPTRRPCLIWTAWFSVVVFTAFFPFDRLCLASVVWL